MLTWITDKLNALGVLPSPDFNENVEQVVHSLLGVLDGLADLHCKHPFLRSRLAQPICTVAFVISTVTVLSGCSADHNTAALPTSTIALVTTAPSSPQPPATPVPEQVRVNDAPAEVLTATTPITVATPTLEPIASTPSPDVPETATETSTEGGLVAEGRGEATQSSQELAQTIPLTATLNLENNYFAKNPPEVKIRRGPEDHFLVTGQVVPEEEVVLLGRNQNSSKVLVRVDNETEGWTWSHIFAVSKEQIADLPVVEAPADILDEEKINRIMFGGVKSDNYDYETYLKNVIREIQQAHQNGSAPILNTGVEIKASPYIAEFAQAFEECTHYDLFTILDELTDEDWLIPTYHLDFLALDIRVYDGVGGIGWNSSGPPEPGRYRPVIEVSRGWLEAAMRGEAHAREYVRYALVKEMMAVRWFYLSNRLSTKRGVADLQGRVYNNAMAAEMLSLYSVSLYRQTQDDPGWRDYMYLSMKCELSYTKRK